MRISDWSSDVCSSDLADDLVDRAQDQTRPRRHGSGREIFLTSCRPGARELRRPFEHRRTTWNASNITPALRVGRTFIRSEERRLGQELVSKCSSRCWPYHSQKKTKKQKSRKAY